LTKEINANTHNIKKVCVFCASSSKTPQKYLDDAAALGRILAENEISVVYGGGAVGLMGALADAVLLQQGQITGVIPKFMVNLEWAHPGVKHMEIVNTMHERKNRMIAGTDAVIALPGGSGTLEELLEVITLKRLTLYTKPIVIINLADFYNPLFSLFERAIDENLMDERHRSMWTEIPSSHTIIEAIRNSADWSEDARNFAAL
jgi:uncharacterized protein (TIGR00730 family)